MPTKANLPMFTRIHPLDVTLFFEDRPYMLGETINLRLELTATGDVEVREARVDLVREERWTEVFTMLVPVHRPMPGIRGAAPISIPMVPKQVTDRHRGTYVHSSIVFLRDTRLPPGTMRSYSASLEIRPEISLNAVEATERWRLVTALDVARARDITRKYTIKVTRA